MTNFEFKQLQAQNEKLRETLVRMRDLSAHEKSETIKLQKDNEELKRNNTELTKSSDKYQSENETLEAQIGELQEQVDAALGAEEMVVNKGSIARQYWHGGAVVDRSPIGGARLHLNTNDLMISWPGAMVIW